MPLGTDWPNYLLIRDYSKKRQPGEYLFRFHLDIELDGESEYDQLKTLLDQAAATLSKEDRDEVKELLKKRLRSQDRWNDGTKPIVEGLKLPS